MVIQNEKLKLGALYSSKFLSPIFNFEFFILN